MDNLEQLISKENIKKLNSKNSEETVSLIRDFLVDKVMKSGGHLASNLGVVELTLALHKVFDFPNDKIVFDVGHQSYVHKILSGRYDKFDTLRKLDGISGFPKTEESEYDSFNTGHSSTSISAALGIAKGRDLIGDNYKVIAFIGDGSIGGGMAFEALNDAGDSNTDLIIILNDNEMSINPNVGGLSAHLSMLRLNKKYIKAKNSTQKMLNKFGSFGLKTEGFLKKIKKAVKRATIAIPMFEDLGLTYIGIIDGHNIDDLVAAMTKAKNTKGPVIIHTLTQKGKGYKPAEDDPDIFHGVSSESAQKTGETYTDYFGKYMSKKARSNKNIVAITAAMCSGCGLSAFAKEIPGRFYDVGISEQHAVTLAAGLSKTGIIPVFAVYSTFLQRGYDQLIHDVCLQNLHVVFAIDRAGVVGEDGETHQGIFDLSYLSHMPNMTILAPTCKKEFEQMLDYAIDEATGPVAIRYPKSEIPERECEVFKNGECESVFDNGDDVVIFSIGRMFDCCMDVVENLVASDIKVKLINIRSIKPNNKTFINNIIKNCKIAFTVEDNEISGGAGQYISSLVLNNYRNKIINIGFDDCFVCQGSQKELFEKYGLNAESITQKILKELNTNEQQN